jgi:hypothetical protein
MMARDRKIRERKAGQGIASSKPKPSEDKWVRSIAKRGLGNSAHRTMKKTAKAERNEVR